MTVRRSLSRFLVVFVSGASAAVFAAPDGWAQAPRAAYGYVTTNLNQRAGPGTQYPPLQVIPSRSQVLINGCLPDFSWCEGV
jgi:uncharacterized protein YraI